MIVRILAAIAALLAAPAAAAGPRIVSLNPCVDAVLMHVADAGQIAGISHYSKDPRSSSIAPGQAARFVATSGTAEEVISLRPDVVIAGAHVAPSTVQALKRLGIKLVQVGVPATVAQSQAEVLAIAAAAGHPARGQRLAASMGKAVARAHWPGQPVPALIWQDGGLVPGSGTLADALLRATGFANASAGYGLQQWDVLPLEYLVAKPPRVLFSSGAERGDRLLGHPALKRLAGTLTAPYPPRLLHCAGPTIIEAAGRLAAARRALR